MIAVLTPRIIVISKVHIFLMESMIIRLPIILPISGIFRWIPIILVIFILYPLCGGLLLLVSIHFIVVNLIHIIGSTSALVVDIAGASSAVGSAAATVRLVVFVASRSATWRIVITSLLVLWIILLLLI
jgi:hypothetical protein